MWCTVLVCPCRAHPLEQQGATAPAPAAAAAKSGSSSSQQQQQQAPPSPSQLADLLYSKWLVDVPRMMDLAVLYAPGSTQLVQQLLHQLLMLQPKYAQVRREEGRSWGQLGTAPHSIGWLAGWRPGWLQMHCVC